VPPTHNHTGDNKTPNFFLRGQNSTPGNHKSILLINRHKMINYLISPGHHRVSFEQRHYSSLTKKKKITKIIMEKED
jgi:hypothetical protein